MPNPHVRIIRKPRFYSLLVSTVLVILVLLAIPLYIQLHLTPESQFIFRSAEAFPRCSTHSCFNFSRCNRNSSQYMLVYSYNSPQPLLPKPTYMHQFPSSVWHTSEPHEACLFFYFSDSLHNEQAWLKPSLRALPFWNNGLNHVIITFADRWSDTNPSPQSIGMASILSTNLHNTSYRPGFDISIPLPRLNFDIPPHLPKLKPFHRKYFLTFKGTRYLSRRGAFRSSRPFRGMHNGVDVIVATTCRHETNDKLLRWQPWLDQGRSCEKDQAVYERYDYVDLLNSTFGLAPAGRQAASYRLLEVLSAGAIPVLIVEAPNYVKPFSGKIQWERCVLEFGVKELDEIVGVLRGLEKTEVEARQTYCQQIFDQFLKDDNVLMKSVMRSLEDRLHPTLPKVDEMHTKP